MQNDRSSSQFSLHLQYISRKEMITARKTIRSTPSYRAIPSCLVEGSRSEGRNERKTSGEMRRGGGQYLGRASKSFLQRAWRSFFLFFSKYLLSISRIVETRLDFRVFLESLRYGGKKKKRENKREEKERGGEMEGSEGGRRRKQRGEERVAHNGANEKEEGERVRKRKKNRRGRDVSSRAFHFPCLSFLPSPPARQRSFRRGTRSQVFSGPIRDEVSNGKFERINHFPRG